MFNILPVKRLVNKDGKSATHAELFYGTKPCIGDFRVFGRPCLLEKWITHFDCKVLTKQTERGIRCMFIGFANNQKGFLVYLPSTRRITTSADVLFDESFQTTGSIEDIPEPVEEGEFEEGNDEDDEPPPLLTPEDDDSVSDEADSDEEDDPDDDGTIGPQEDTSPFHCGQ